MMKETPENTGRREKNAVMKSREEARIFEGLLLFETKVTGITDGVCNMYIYDI